MRVEAWKEVLDFAARNGGHTTLVSQGLLLSGITKRACASLHDILRGELLRY